VQTVNALTHFKEMISVLKSYEFERFMGGTLIRREPIGVCGLITPWNWPLNQVTSKLAPETEDEAVAIANGTSYGLAGYVQGRDIERVRRVAARIRAGRIYLNGAPVDRSVPFGGYKQSGNGREHGVFGSEEYLEVKAVLGYHTA